jgi:hypothetical protein
MPRRKILILVAIIAFAALTTTATAPPWQVKDWHLWTVDDCDWILQRSPWASPFHTGEAGETVNGRTASNARVLITSSLAVRRALVKTSMRPNQQKIDACLNQDFSDRILVTVVPKHDDDFARAPELIISGRKYSAISAETVNLATDPCLNDSEAGNVFDLAHGGEFVGALAFVYPRVVEGKRIIGPADKKFVIMSSKHRDFNFDIRKMIYNGKPDF